MLLGAEMTAFTHPAAVMFDVKNAIDFIKKEKAREGWRIQPTPAPYFQRAVFKRSPILVDESVAMTPVALETFELKRYSAVVCDQPFAAYPASWERYLRDCGLGVHVRANSYYPLPLKKNRAAKLLAKAGVKRKFIKLWRHGSLVKRAEALNIAGYQLLAAVITPPCAAIPDEKLLVVCGCENIESAWLQFLVKE